MIDDMKRYSFLLPVFVLLISCSHQRHGSGLRQIAQMVSSHPDSARTLLVEMDGSSLKTRRERARHALLLCQASDLCYIDLQNDSMARVAVDYFDRHGPWREQMMAHYYQGIAQRNAEDPVAAMRAFETACKVASAHGNWHYAGLCWRNLGVLYANEYDDENAFRCFQESVHCFEQAHEKRYADFSRIAWARTSLALRDYRTCDSLFQMVLAECPDDSALKSSLFLTRARHLSMQCPMDAAGTLQYYRETEHLAGEPLTADDFAKKGAAWASLDFPDSAFTCFGQALLLSKDAVDSANVDYFQAFALYAGGHDREAFRHLEKAFSSSGLSRIPSPSTIVG